MCHRLCDLHSNRCDKSWAGIPYGMEQTELFDEHQKRYKGTFGSASRTSESEWSWDLYFSRACS